MVEPAAPRLTAGCHVETARLRAVPWHDRAPTGTPLTDIVLGLLTPAVTRTLPPNWQHVDDQQQAEQWIADRDRESTVLAVSTDGDQTVGLVILGEEPHTAGPVDVRLGYLLAPTAWGQGLASELVGGLVAWCRAEPLIGSLTGGVARDNPASARVLTTHGFEVVDATGSEDIYRLTW